MAEEIENDDHQIDEDAFLAAKQLDNLRMQGLDYALKNGLQAAQLQYPSIALFLAEWEGKSSGDYIEYEVTKGFGL
jgi:hypothetical protein